MEDLVTLRAGLESTSGAGYGGWVQSGNWVAHALRRPMIDMPGGRMHDSTGSTHVLGAAITTATGKSLLTLARERLGGAIGHHGARLAARSAGLRFRRQRDELDAPRHAAKLALLMRDRGRFGGAQVISQAWIDASLTRRTQSPFSGLH